VAGVFGSVGRTQEMLRLKLRATQLDPLAVHFAVQYLGSLVAAKRLDEADRFLEDARLRLPPSPWLWAWRVLVLVSSGKQEEALRLCDSDEFQSSGLSPEDRVGMRAVAWILT